MSGAREVTRPARLGTHHRQSDRPTVFAMNAAPYPYKSLTVRHRDGVEVDQVFEVDGTYQRLAHREVGEELQVLRHTFTQPYGIWSAVVIARFPLDTYGVSAKVS